MTFEGRRYRVTRGTIDFTNPTRIEPFFDVEAETNVRVPGQTYRVTVGVRRARSEQLRPTLSSDPPLPAADVLALLFSDVRARHRRTSRRAARAAEPEPDADRHPRRRARRRRSPAPISSEVGKVVEQTFGVDTFQLTPSFIDPYSTADVAAESDGAADDRQAHLRSRLPDVLAQPRHDRSTIRSSCSRSTRATRCRGCCRATRTRRPTRSSSA